jgi:outer membrane protein assembly factor BamB
MHILLRACGFILALAFSAPALAQTDLTGWWRADITYGGETEPMYFHFTTNAAGAPRLRISQLVARMEDVPVSEYAIEGSTLRLPNLNLTLTVTADGRAIDGVLPPTFVSHEPTPIHFVRSEPPAALAPLPEPLGPPPSPRWTAPLHAEVWGGLARDGTRSIFVADISGHVTALAQNNGAQFWRANLGAQIRSTPTLRNGRLYVASDAALVALDARTGRQIWSAPFGAERAARIPISETTSRWDHYSSGVAVDDELAVAGARDGCVHAVRARTGAPVWRMCTQDLVTSTPALTRDGVYFGGFDHFAYALSRADGRVLWRYDTHDIVPRDAIVAGDNVLFGSRTYDITALNARTGERAWFRHIWNSWVDSPPAVADSRIYTGTSDALAVFAYDESTGGPIWKAPVPGWTWGGVALGAHSVYTGIVGGAYGAPRAGGFAAFSRADGTLRWRLDAPRPDPLTMYGFAAMPVVSGSRLFAADLSGNAYAFDDPGG